LQKYAKVHFAAEEAFMIRCGYPEYDRHRQQHLDFIKKMAHLALQTTQQQSSVPIELVEFMENWLMHHVLISDMEYRRFNEEKDEN